MSTLRRTFGIAAGVVVIAAGAVVALADTGQAVPASTTKSIAAQPLTADFNMQAVGISAPAAELIDASTGQILYAHNITVRHYPASIVKLMTSLMALELVKKGQMTLNSIIPVSNAAYQVAMTPGLSVAYLNPLERIPLWKMLEYMYVVSADDAAVALGDAISGSESQFAKAMTAKAQSLHMMDTKYTNASGLQDPQQYTTAYDVGKLTRYLINKYPVVLKYAAVPGMYIHPGQYGATYDQLLGQYKGLDGLKTGSTDQAGYCFVGTAKRGSTRLISIVLDTKSFTDVFQDTAALLDYGFSTYQTVKLQSAGDSRGLTVSVANGSQQTLAVAPKQDVMAQVPRGGKIHVQTSLTVTKFQAPVKAGEQVGEEQVILAGHVVEQLPVYALKSDPQAGLVEKLFRSVMASAHSGARRLLHKLHL